MQPALVHLQNTELPQEHLVLPFCAHSASGLVSSSCGHSPLEDAGVLESDVVTRYLHARAGLSFGLLEAAAHSCCAPPTPLLSRVAFHHSQMTLHKHFTRQGFRLCHSDE